MITFQQLCELLTHNQRYSWFLMPRTLVDSIDVDDKQLVFIESTREPNEVRLWYPREKYFNRKMDVEERMRLIQKALDSGELEIVVELRRGI